MQVDDLVRTLQKAGSAQTRKTYARHGIPEPMFGVSYAVLRPLAKKIGVNQPLAEQLWATGNYDCRELAGMIADAARISRRTLDAWAKSMVHHCSNGELAKIVARRPDGPAIAAEWCAAKSEQQNWAGWNTIAMLANEAHRADEDDGLDELFDAALDAIAIQLPSSPNFTRYVMNGALIAIGGSRPALKRKALEIAKQLGPVDVDHGDTDCKTPDATTYIKKMWARRK